MGARVIAVDKASLAPEVARLPGIQYRQERAFALDPRGSPGWLRFSSANGPVAADGLVEESACSTTPTSDRGSVVLSRNGVVNALYTT